ncbi:MAG: hypothetical protein OEY59_06535 [Deltaproteobacteria bacterium]|nr:hypothetical protein [Deltaproteobacteria bacterium]
MSKFVWIFATAFLMLGCSSSKLPGPIPEEFLEHRTPAEIQKLEEVELQIISKPDEKVMVLKDARLSNLKINQSKSKIQQLETQKKEAESLLKQFKEKKDAEGLKKQAHLLNEIQQMIVDENINLNYFISLNQFQKAQVDLISAELATLVAEQRLIHARIGRRNQDDLLGAVPKGSNAGDRIDIKLYDEYFKNRSQQLIEVQKNKKEAEALYRKADTSFQDLLQRQTVQVKIKPQESADKALQEDVKEETKALQEDVKEETKALQEDVKEESKEEAKPDVKAPATQAEMNETQKEGESAAVSESDTTNEKLKEEQGENPKPVQ